MHRNELIHHAVRRIYEATLEPEQWSSAIASVAEAGGAHRAILHAAASGGSMLAVSTGFPDGTAFGIHREINRRLPAWVEAVPCGTALRQTSAISDADFRKSDLYNQAVKPAGGFYGIVAPLVRRPERRVLLTLARDEGAADFTMDDVRVATLIGPHIVNAIKVAERIADHEGRAAVTFDAIAKLDMGVIIVDERLRPIIANPCAEALASRRDGLILMKDALSASHPKDADALVRAVTEAARFATMKFTRGNTLPHSSSWNISLRRRPPRRPLAAKVIPVTVPAAWCAGTPSPCAIVFIVERERPLVVDHAFLVAGFNLTRQEAALAVLLANGRELSDAADEMHISTGTARSYLKRILSKTDTHRQAELVSLLLRGGSGIRLYLP